MEIKQLTVVDILHDIQKSLKVPKKHYNAFAKFYGRKCEDIMEALKSLLPNGAVVYLSDKLTSIGERVYVEVTATIEYRGEMRSAVAYAREQLEKKGMDQAQVTGAASSYAGKYALGKLFLIDDTDDADSQQNHDKPESHKVTAMRPVSKISEDTYTALISKFSELVTSQSKIDEQLSKRGLKSLTELSEGQGQSWLSSLSKKETSNGN